MSDVNDANVEQSATPAAPAAPASPAAPAPVQQVRTNTMAIVALIASFFVALVGVILGHIALSQIKKTHEGGRGLAIAALIIGYIGIAAWVILIIVWIVVVAAATSMGY